MAFGRLGNQHDTWLRFCEQYVKLLAQAGLPDSIIRNESWFRDLLRDGSASGREVAVSLAELSPKQWAGLKGFVDVFFHECESYASLELFPAYRREAESRDAAQDVEPSRQASGRGK